VSSLTVGPASAGRYAAGGFSDVRLKSNPQEIGIGSSE